MLSIIVPFKNDWQELETLLKYLLSSKEIDNLEIIIVNDGSVENSGKFKPLIIDNKQVKVVNLSQSFGVGHSFDRGVEQASNDTIILMGVDVTPHEGWYEKVISAVESNPNSIGCAVCVSNSVSVAKDGTEYYKKYYGAEMLFTYGMDDLPPESKLRERKGGFTDLFRGRWASKKSDEPYEISCLMGAFYFTTKTWYQAIGGFDTEPGNRYCGHRVWSHLEPHLSLKSYLHGGNCILHPDIEVTHIFNRIDRRNRWSKGSRSAEWFHWNSQWILETMVLNEFTRNRIRDFKTRELNWNEAEKMIRDNYATILRYRESNRLKIKFSLENYINKFNIKI